MESQLDYKSALQFVAKIGLVNGEELMKDRLDFVNKLILAYQEHVPFQCISIIAQTASKRHVPTIDEVIEAAMSLEGGVCYTLNTFMCILLKALNFNADVVDGSYSAFGDSHTHVVVLLSDVRYAGDNFIVDVGCGFPFQDPIPISELPCSRYFAGLEYRYKWQDRMILRLHRMGDQILDNEKPVMTDGWRQVFHFDLKPVTFDHFRPFMEHIYVDDTGSDFHTTLRAIRFPPATFLETPPDAHSSEANSVSSSNRKGCEERIMVAFKNQSLLIGPMDNALKKKIDTEDWANEIKKHFPNIPAHKVDRAVQQLLGTVN